MALFLTYALPLLLPSALYVLWRLIWPPRTVATDGAADGSEAPGAASLWRDAPWLWLALAGAALLVITLLLGIFVHGSPPSVQYVPPRIENGRIVPGEMRPAAPPSAPGEAR